MTLKHKIVTIRKPRRCFSCSEMFDKGARMAYNVGIWEGDFSTAYYCLCCSDYIDKHMHYDDTWGEGDFRGEEHYKQFKKQWNEDKAKSGEISGCSRDVVAKVATILSGRRLR